MRLRQVRLDALDAAPVRVIAPQGPVQDGWVNELSCARAVLARAVAPGTPRTVSAAAGDVSSRVEAGIPVQVLLGVASGMLVQPHDRCIGVPARNQHPRDVVRLDAREVWAHTLR